MPLECGPSFAVVGERKRGLCLRVGKDLIEQVQAVRMDIVFEPVPVVALQPRPGNEASLLVPQTEIPVVLAVIVPAQVPCDVAYVPLCTRAQQLLLLERELLDRRDDLGREPHGRIIRTSRSQSTVLDSRAK